MAHRIRERQTAAEVLVSPDVDGVSGQTVIEVLTTPLAPNAQMALSALEVLTTPLAPSGVVAQVALEVLVAVDPLD